MPELRPTERRERAVLVGLATGSKGRARIQDYLEELSMLADSAGADVVATLVQERSAADAATFVGRGKAEEIAGLVKEKEIDLVIFDDDLSAVQVRNLERLISCKIIDRSALILDIFALRARTREAKTQVELAQLQYMLPRLTRQWTHLSKQYGGIGTKGPGETQIETDRRAIRTRISHLNEKLQRVDRERAVQRKGRDQFMRIALVGYTNAGKSTILNWFTEAGVLVENRLFATLDSTVRLLTLSPLHKVLLSDTVGFIRKLPHHLVASFKSTLDEVREADVLLHVVDVSHPLFEEQIAVVNETLEELGGAGKPTMMVFNKIDRLQQRSMLHALSASHPDATLVSAARGINMTTLRNRLTAFLDTQVIEQTLEFGIDDAAGVALLHEVAEVLEKSYDEKKVLLRVRIPRVIAERLAKTGHLQRRIHR